MNNLTGNRLNSYKNLLNGTVMPPDKQGEYTNHSEIEYHIIRFNPTKHKIILRKGLKMDIIIKHKLQYYSCYTDSMIRIFFVSNETHDIINQHIKKGDY